MKDAQDVLDSFIEGNEIFAALNKIKTTPNTPCRVVLLTKNFNKELSELFSLIGESGIKFELKKENKSHRLWEIEVEEDENSGLVECPHCKKEFKADLEEKYELKYYLVEFLDSNLLMLVTNSKHSFDKLINAFNSVYPLISRIFYRAWELRMVLNHINGLRNIEVIGRECVFKTLYEDKKTVVTYQEDTVDAFFERAKRENSWVDSIEVIIKPLGTIRISRKGTILYSEPFNFTGFFETIVTTIMNELLIKRREQFKLKSRTLEDPSIKPIVMKFEKEYFEEETNIKKLVKRLNESDRYEISVIYLSPSLSHIEGYDYANGGGFDIYINKANELRIIPQTQFNEIAIESMINNISDIFEGMIQ